MKHSTLAKGMSALAVCALLFPALGSQKNPVQRPFKSQSQETVVLCLDENSPDYFKWEAQESGQATHLGRFSGVGSGSCDPGTYVISGDETLTAANGDQLFLHLEGSGSGTGMVDTITGGTGRFEHATGSILSHIVSEVDDWGATTLTVTYTIVSEGTITY
jgi:hypothetical protein